jgi:hypothetical protein
MSDWNHNVVFICPIAQQEVAKRISRSLDPDIGGYEAFNSLASADGNEPATHVIYGTPVRESFVTTVQALSDSNTPLANRTAALKQMVDTDYAARWPSEIPPTLAECEAFLSDLVVYVDTSWDEALTHAGLSVIPQSPV